MSLGRPAVLPDPRLATVRARTAAADMRLTQYASREGCADKIPPAELGNEFCVLQREFPELLARQEPWSPGSAAG